MGEEVVGKGLGFAVGSDVGSSVGVCVGSSGSYPGPKGSRIQ